jgi:4-amino-4-deoxy-L-arabinose transferase-like glycosyltransferase
MSEDTRPLTPAQIRHLTRLNEAVLQAQASLQEFIVYLREEHDAPASDWKLEDLRVGFEKVVSASTQEPEVE